MVAPLHGLVCGHGRTRQGNRRTYLCLCMSMSVYISAYSAKWLQLHVFCRNSKGPRWREWGPDTFCPKDSGRNRATNLCNNSILQSQMGGALKIVRGSRLLIIFDILTFFGPKWAIICSIVLCIQNYKLSSHNKTAIIVSLYPPSLQEYYIRCLSYLILKNWVENCQFLKPDALTRRYGPSVDCPMWKLSEKWIKCSCF